jgi:hypothetical protein
VRVKRKQAQKFNPFTLIRFALPRATKTVGALEQGGEKEGLHLFLFD